MPSAISKEDLRSELYQAGVKDPQKLNKVMQFTDIYAYALHRKLSDRKPPLVIPAMKAGEWDAVLEVTCCTECERVKRWEYFHADGRHPTGHKTTCKLCRVIPAAEEGWTCRTCGKRRKKDEFPPEKAVNPRRSIPCVWRAEEKERK